MRGRTSVIRACAALLALGAAGAALGQAPVLSQATTTARGTLSAAQQAEVGAFADHWLTALRTGEPARVKDARTKLIQPVALSSLVFRDAYGRILAARMESIVSGENHFAAINALHVAAAVASPETVELLLHHTAVSGESRSTVRLTAAKLLSVALPEGMKAGAIATNEANQAARTIGRAAAVETDWIALLRQFEAVAAVVEALGGVSGTDAGTAIKSQLDALAATIQRMEQVKGGTSDLMRAVRPTLYHLRNRYLDLLPAEQKALGTQLTPHLGRVLDVARSHWETAQKDPEMKIEYGGAIKLSEDLLALIDQKLRSAGTLQTALKVAWDNGDKPRFEAEHSKWIAVLAGPPYRR
jgi:hypothetical protein